MDATSKCTTPERKINKYGGRKSHEGPLHCQWDEDAPVTLHDYLPFFSEYLRAGGLFQDLVESCLIRFRSNNAPEVADVVGTLVISLLSGHTLQYCRQIFPWCPVESARQSVAQASASLPHPRRHRLRK